MNNVVSISLVMIRSTNLERANNFYGTLGLEFTLHKHGSGPEHLACEMDRFVFEVYPRKDDSDSTSATRIGFRVPSVDAVVERLQHMGAKLVSPPKESPWGRRAVVDDFDGHRVELTE